MNLMLKYILLFSLVLLSSSVISQDIYYEHFTGVDGLPSMTTYEMLQDSNGLLWIGTENGLVSYDGDEFKRYTHPDFIDNDIIEIALDIKGRIYFINLSGQLAYIENAEVNLIDTDTISGNIINIVTTEDQVYVTARINLLESENTLDDDYPSSLGEFETVNFIVSEESNHEFHLETNRCVLFLAEEGKYRPYQSVVETEEEFTLESESDSISLKQIRRGWLKNEKANCYFYVNHPLIYVEIDSTVNSFIKKDKTLRANRQKGVLFIRTSEACLFFNLRSGKPISFLKGVEINEIFIDRESNAWLSTSIQGLYKIPHFYFQFESFYKAYSKGFGINDIVFDQDGFAYIGTSDGKVLVYSNEQEPIAEYSVHDQPVSFYESKDKIYGISEPKIFKSILK